MTVNWFNSFTNGYKLPCRILEYQGEKIMERVSDEGNNTYEIYYEFAPPMKVTSLQEYLIFDMVGMIGSVGGSLGMCIGLSFSGLNIFTKYYGKQINEKAVNS